MSNFDRTIIDLVESTSRNFKALPLNLGAVQGSGGGVGAPPGGYIGWLPQTRVAYDTDEFAYSGLPYAPSGSLVDNLAHIRYRLNILESGGSIIVTDDNNSLSYYDTTNLHFMGSGVLVTNLGGGEVRVTVNATGSGGGGGDGTYLRLDATNDPVTGELEINTGPVNTGNPVLQTTSDEVGNAAWFTQLSYAGSSTTPAVVIEKTAYGGSTGNLGGPALLIATSDSTGTVDGDFIQCEHNLITKFNVDYLGNAYSDGELLITDAPINGLAYSRKDGGWVVASGGGTSLTVKEFDETPTISGVDTIIFSGVQVTDLGSGDVLVATEAIRTTGTVLYFAEVIQDIVVDSSFPYSLSPRKSTAGTQSSSASSISTTPVRIRQHMTDVLSSGFETITKGTFKVYITLRQTAGTKEVTAYAVISKVNQAGTVTTLTTTSSTPVITSSYVTYELAVNDGPFTLSRTDRILVQIYAVGSVSGTNATIGTQTGNTDGERLELPTTSDAYRSELQFGWISIANVWTRTGNYTFTVAGDFTGTYRKGVKVRYKDGGSYEYGVIASSSYSSPNTTVTLITNSDYAMAAATITDTYVSYIENPEGWPEWFSYSPTSNGFSAQPSSDVYKWKSMGGNSLMVIMRQAGNGTSNATTFTIDLPVTARTVSNMVWSGTAVVADNGTVSTTPSLLRIQSGASVMDVYNGWQVGAAFTNSGGKRMVQMNPMVYEF